MRICITSNGPNLDSLVDPRFGRCLHFIFINDKGQEFSALKNTGVRAMRGAGITAAQIVADQGAEVVITGNIGPNAFGVLMASGVKIFQAIPGTRIKDVLTAFNQGQLRELTQPFGGGMSPGGPPGFGRGGPGGRGPGQGRGGRRR